ncbi:MAG TPA: energy transducer TonB [Gammaproteobacteria bacterium]|jgi:TonB family protein|nr:energy transducer TonB [Gammaproteobacteria bacterium]
MTTAKKSSSNQADLLLWIAGGAIAAIGAAWLVIMQPWKGGADEHEIALAMAPTSSAAVAPALTATAEAVAGDAAAAPEAELDNPLRMAQLAYDAGMLVEPDEYSAWTLFQRVLKNEPDNAAALEGLTKVADDLVRRGETALDQGRFDDARATVERIRAALPKHEGAKELAQKIWPDSGGKPAAPALPQPEVQVARLETSATPAPPPKPQVDPIAEANQSLEKALAEGRLLTPADQSAKHYVAVLNRLNVDHDLTKRARTTLSAEFLSRAAQSIEALDPEAAGIWIDEAEALIGATDDGVRKARAALTEQLIAMETAKPIPASALKISTYVAPDYPPRASERNIQGWVDVEFTVGTDGKTRNIVVTDASHDTMFRREATEAVQKWQFEPRVFMGRPIEQTSFTRIRFVL